MSDQYVTVRRDGSLHIDRVRLSDAGDYSCLAENAIGATNHTTTINVYGRGQNDASHIIVFVPWLYSAEKRGEVSIAFCDDER